jgi:hypothetical protein
MLNLFRPNRSNLAIVLVLLSLTSLAVSQREATSKVTWKESRGAPWPYLNLAEYRGPCPPSGFCTEVHIDTFHPFALLIDILSWYFVSCLVLWGYRRMPVPRLNKR